MILNHWNSLNFPSRKRPPISHNIWDIFVTVISVPRGRLPASVNFCNNEKEFSTDYPYWQITRTQKQRKPSTHSKFLHCFCWHDILKRAINKFSHFLFLMFHWEWYHLQKICSQKKSIPRDQLIHCFCWHDILKRAVNKFSHFLFPMFHWEWYHLQKSVLKRNRYPEINWVGGIAWNGKILFNSEQC